MKKIMILVLVLNSVCFGFLPRGNVDSYAKSNAIVANPTDSLNSLYSQLKSSDRDGVMGTLSATNRRVILLTPGTYTQTSTLVLDTDYVDIASVSGHPKDTVISSSACTVVKQTCNDICLTGFTIRTLDSANGRHGFELVVTTGQNTNSIYKDMDFRAYDGGAGALSRCVTTTNCNLDGTWIGCNADGNAWRLYGDNSTVSATMIDCVAGDYSYGGDNAYKIGGDISGKFYRCTGGDSSFGGCDTVGLNATRDSLFDHCISGNTSFCMGKDFGGTAIDCRGGHACFGGSYGGSGNVPKFSGKAIGCTVEGLAGSFGTGYATAEMSGQIINCKYNSISEQLEGLISSRVGLVVDNSVEASLATALTGANNDFVFTAKNKGEIGNEIHIVFEQGDELEVWSDSFSVGSNQYGRYYIGAVINAGVTLASEVKTALEADADIMALISVAYSGADTGAGTVGLFDGYLTGGLDRPMCSGSYSFIPQACVANTTVSFFDNGQTYTNAGDDNAINFTLPKAVVGLEYTFIDASATATADVTITADGAETIGSLGTSAVGNTDDTYGIIHIKCVADGTWVIIDSTGTWN